MKRRKSGNVDEISMPLTNLSLEEFEQIINSGCIEGEVPFNLLAEQYPSLLSEWYPGYPGTPRPMTEQDPIPARAQIQKCTMTIAIRGQEISGFSINTTLADGMYDVWLKKDKNETWSVYFTTSEKIT